MVFMSRWRATAAGLALVALLTSCGAAGAGQAGPRPHVVAAFYPYAFVAQRVLGGDGTVTDLTRNGVEPHDLELTPQQVAEIGAADLVIYEKSFQPAVDAAVTQNPPRLAIDVASIVPLRNTGNAVEGSLPADPHIWLNPLLLIPVVDEVAADATTLRPADGAHYRADAAHLVRQLRALDREYSRGLAHCRLRDFVTSHAAFGYLAERYHLTMLPIAGLSPEAEPSPKHIAELQQLIRQHHITTVFSEVLGTQKYADSLAHDLGVKAAVLDPIEGLTSSDPHATYLTLMRSNLAALQKANGCT